MKFVYRVNLENGQSEVEADFYETEGDFVTFYRRIPEPDQQAERVASFPSRHVLSVREVKRD